MNRNPSSKNEKQKFVSDKGNQITTYQKEPTTWIDISDSEFPEGITNQRILQIFEYRQPSNPPFANDVTVLEENIIQEIEVSTSCAQTEYLIDKQKYLKQDIKPYFLYFFEIDGKGNTAPSGESSLSSGDVSVLNEDKDLSVESSLSRVDKATWISPVASTFITEYLKGLSDKTVSDGNNTFGSKVNPVLPGTVFCSHDNVQRPVAPKLSKELTEVIICAKSSIGNVSQLVDELNLEKKSDKDDTAIMSQSPENNPESSKIVTNVGKTVDEVNILCKQGSVKFNLKCKRVEDVSNQNVNPDQTVYACKINKEKSQNFEKVLENFNHGGTIDSKVVPHDINDIKCTDTNEGSLPPQESKPSLTMKPSPIPIFENQNTENQIQSREPVIKITIKASVPAIDHTEDKESNETRNNTPEKTIFACRSKSKQSEDATDDVEIKVEKCESNMISNVSSIPNEEEIQTIQNNIELKEIEAKGPFNNLSNSCIIDKMIETHNTTVNLLKAAASDIICNIPDQLSKVELPYVDQCTVDKMKQQAENYTSNLKKNIESNVVPEVKKTSKMLLENSCKVVKSITKCTGLLGDENVDKDKECSNIRDSGGPKKTSCSRDGSGLDVSESIEKMRDSFVKTAEETKKSITELVCQGIKTLGIEEVKPSPPQSEDPIENLKVTAEKLVSDVRKKTEEFKEMSPEERIDLLRRATENVKKSLTDLAAESKAILKMSPEQRSDLIKKTTENIQKSITNIIITDDVKCLNEKDFKNVINDKNDRIYVDDDEKEPDSRLVSMKKSAADFFQHVGETTLKIKKSVEDVVNLEDTKENVTKVLSGIHLFKKMEEPAEKIEPEEKNTLQNSISSTFSAITSTLAAGLNKFDTEPEKSSAYDNPTPPKQIAYDTSSNNNDNPPPPRQIAYDTSVNRVTGMFTTIKDKIYSIFSGPNKEPDAQSPIDDDDDEGEDENIDIDERLSN